MPANAAKFMWVGTPNGMDIDTSINAETIATLGILLLSLNFVEKTRNKKVEIK